MAAPVPKKIDQVFGPGSKVIDLETLEKSQPTCYSAAKFAPLGEESLKDETRKRSRVLELERHESERQGSLKEWCLRSMDELEVMGRKRRRVMERKGLTSMVVGQRLRTSDVSDLQQDDVIQSSEKVGKHKKKNARKGCKKGKSSRRAFGDVTNSSRNIDNGAGVKPIAEKRIPRQPEPDLNSTDIIPPVPRRRNHQRSSVVANSDSYQYTGKVSDIDDCDAENPLCVTAYVQDMYEHFCGKEMSTSARPGFIEAQPHINARIRSVLVDWLVEVHLKFKLLPETLYLTVNMVDRYLERKEVSRSNLQLVGVASLLIASKYEETCPPELRDLVYICDQAFTRDEIIEMEVGILKTLEYQITVPSAFTFLCRFLKAAKADKKIVQLSCYLLDGTLQSYNLNRYLPSQLAAAAVFLARRAVGRHSWSPTLLRYANYCEEEITPVARAVLEEKASCPTELCAVKKKYTITKYGGVADTVLVCDF